MGSFSEFSVNTKLLPMSSLNVFPVIELYFALCTFPTVYKFSFQSFMCGEQPDTSTMK